MTRVRPKHPKPPASPPPVVSPPPVTSPPPVMTGTVQTHRPGKATPFGVPWSNVSRWEPSFINAAAEFGVDPRLMRAMAIVESDANQFQNGGAIGGDVIGRNDGFGDGPSVGIMQVKPKIWKSLVPDADPYTADGNIRLGTAIMAQAIRDHGSWQKAITNVYFPANDPNGTTQQMYVDTVRSLLAEQGSTTPAPSPPPPQPEPQRDVIDVIMGGAPYGDEYGFKAPTDLPYYGYFEGHGGHPNEHTGIDVTAPIGTPLYSPIGGTVVCAGTGIGQGAYGSSCAAFEYTLGAKTGSSGRFEILHDDGKRSLIFGHVLRSLVPVGTKVQPGQRVAEIGGQNGPHCHVEARIWAGGKYTIVDPRQAFGGGVVYAERAPFDLSDANPEAKVTVIADSVPVLQYANPEAAPVRAPLSKGEVFYAGTQVYGTDSQWWWLTSRGSRIPTRGTAEAK